MGIYMDDNKLMELYHDTSPLLLDIMGMWSGEIYVLSKEFSATKVRILRKSVS